MTPRRHIDLSAWSQVLTGILRTARKRRDSGEIMMQLVGYLSQKELDSLLAYMDNGGSRAERA